VCWSDGYFFVVLRLLLFLFYWCVLVSFLRRGVVWCVSAAGGVFACSSVTVCRVLSSLCRVFVCNVTILIESCKMK
jgi:hypothetical protein